MTELESGPIDLPWSQNGYLLFNAVRTENLLPRLYQWNPGVDCYPLYNGTRFNALLDVSPVVVGIEGPHDPVLQPFLENAAKVWGLLLFSNADLKTLFEHLRWLVSVDEPVGKATLLNLSDPQVANALFGLYPLQTDNRLFGPIEHVYAVDRFEQCWRHHQRLGEPAINDHQTLYRLSEAQIEALDETSFRSVVSNIDQHMRRHFPEYQTQLDSRERFIWFFEMAQGKDVTQDERNNATGEATLIFPKNSLLHVAYSELQWTAAKCAHVINSSPDRFYFMQQVNLATANCENGGKHLRVEKQVKQTLAELAEQPDPQCPTPDTPEEETQDYTWEHQPLFREAHIGELKNSLNALYQFDHLYLVLEDSLGIMRDLAEEQDRVVGWIENWTQQHNNEMRYVVGSYG